MSSFPSSAYDTPPLLTSRFLTAPPTTTTTTTAAASPFPFCSLLRAGVYYKTSQWTSSLAKLKIKMSGSVTNELFESISFIRHVGPPYGLARSAKVTQKRINRGTARTHLTQVPAHTQSTVIGINFNLINNLQHSRLS